MAYYVCLVTFTDTGAKNLRKTTKRSSAFHERMQREGIEFVVSLWTIGPYDLVHVFKAKDDLVAAEFAYTLSSLGNVRTNTMRAFTADEIDGILDKVMRPYSFLADLM